MGLWEIIVIIFIIGHFQVHSLQVVTGLPICNKQNSLKVNSIYLTFITEINVTSILVFVCALPQNAISAEDVKTRKIVNI